MPRVHSWPRYRQEGSYWATLAAAVRIRVHAARAWAAATAGVSRARRARRVTLDSVRPTDAAAEWPHTRTASTGCFDDGSGGSVYSTAPWTTSSAIRPRLRAAAASAWSRRGRARPRRGCDAHAR